MSCPENTATPREYQPFQMLFNSVSDGLILLNDQGYCQQINPAACQMLGQSAASLSQRHLNDLSQLGLRGIPPWQNSPNPQTGEFQLQRADGESYRIDYQITPNITPEHHLLNWRLSQTPNRHSRRESAAKNSSNRHCLDLEMNPISPDELEVFYRLQKISENIPGVIYQFCLHPDGSCHFPYASGQFRELYHIIPDTLYDDARAVFEVVHPDDLERVHQSILRSGQTLTPWRCEYRIYSPDRKTRWILGQSRPEALLDGSITWYGYLQDITHQKAIEETLRHSEQQFAKLLHNLNDLIFIADLDGTLSYVSHNFEVVLGYSKRELLNEPFAKFIHPEDLYICIDIFKKALRGEKSQGREYRVLHKDGNYYWHSGNGSPLTNEDGEIIGCLGVARYIQEKKEAENALREQELRLKLALEGSQTGTWDLNLQTQEVVFEEKQWNTFIGCRDETEGFHLVRKPMSEWQERIHPDDEPQVNQAIQAHLAAETERFSSEYRLRCQDGSYKWMLSQGKVVEWDKSGQPLRFMGIYHDISQLKANELALSQLSQQLKKAQEIAKLGYWSFDISSQKLTWSEQVFRLFNHPIEQGEPSFEEYLQQIHPEDRTLTLERVERATQGVPQNFDYRILHPDGTIRHLNARIELEFQNEQVVRLFGTFLDITERVETETALKDSQLRLRLALESSNIGLWDWNLPTNNVTFNGNWGTMLGYEQEEITNHLKEWKVRVHPDDLEPSYALVNKHLQGETDVYQNEHRLRCKDGSYKWILAKGQVVEWDTDGTPIRFIGTHTDIHHRKQAELALIQVNQTLKKAQEVAQLGNWSYDLNRNKISWSEEVFHIFGRSPDQGEPTYEEHLTFYHPDDLPQVLEYIEAAHLGIPQQYDFRLVRPTGQIRYANSRLEVEVCNGKTTRMFGTVIDITERKKNEAIIRQALSAADKANRAKSQFLANMSHELRTPLNAILGFTDIMIHDSNISTEQQSYLTIIHQSGEHLLQIINDILEISKIEAGKVELKPAPFNLAQLLQSLEYLFKLPIDQKGLSFSLSHDSRLPKFINTDELKLRQTLMNLISNAIKFTQKGHVSLEVNLKDGPSQTSPDASSNSLGIEFIIADTGPGIKPEELSVLFQPFSQTETGRAVKQGTGLGLAISRKFIQMMGGDIQVSSTLGKGTVFTFDIQAEPVQLKTNPVSISQPRITHLSPQTEPPRILIADDVEESRLLLKTLLHTMGFQVQEATQGEEALSLWETWQPQLILMDLQMPVLDGYEATRQLRQREAEHRPKLSQNLRESSSNPRPTPIIALTANLFAQEQEAATLAGCDTLIAKPFSEQELFKTIGRYLNLEYLYEDSSPLDLEPFAEASTTEGLIEGLAEMPKSWQKELQQYAKLGSDDLIFSLISRSLRDDCPRERSLAESLLELTRNFQFDRLNELIEASLES
ncbi:PAS domain-containing protein [Phormidium yuhuli AB48]|uniref:histidine kinase n=1 Tax=Phormidium yuhuli AB48 TaxID=2940671 RepID=A0ABY5ARZ6_9CYAN|nr:PAS domain-containing protein [Phormidium yuhuli]USR91997.1 PAS domain-containing protein [Phormidium yuhuli AB48]